jgi:hypothetical protein
MLADAVAARPKQILIGFMIPEFTRSMLAVDNINFRKMWVHGSSDKVCSASCSCNLSRALIPIDENNQHG